MRSSEPRERAWSCHVCHKTVMRLHASAAAIVNRNGDPDVRYRVLGACRDHHQDVQNEVRAAFNKPLHVTTTQIRPNGLARWATEARIRLLAKVAS